MHLEAQFEEGEINKFCVCLGKTFSWSYNMTREVCRNNAIGWAAVYIWIRSVKEGWQLLGIDSPKERPVVFFNNPEFILEVHYMNEIVFRDILCCQQEAALSLEVWTLAAPRW